MVKINDSQKLRELARTLPDIPRWVETRSMLLAGECKVYGLNELGDASFIVMDSALMSVVGLPDIEIIKAVVEDDLECEMILATVEAANLVSQALPKWNGSTAFLHLLGDPPAARTPEGARFISRSELEAMTHLPHDLREELTEAAEYSLIAAGLFDDLPVSFCYAASLTETLWDISIDTLEPYRKRGFATSALVFMIDHMYKLGMHPVWGAEEDNAASMNLAARLGFVVVDQIKVFKRPA